MKKINKFGCLFLLCIVTSLVGCKPGSDYNENIKNLPKEEQKKSPGSLNRFIFDLMNSNKKTPEQKKKEQKFLIRYSTDPLLNPAHPLNPNNTRDYTN